jgi:isopropylmalate/homocitrate/citramalate synthase
MEAGGNRPAWPDTVGCLTPEAAKWYSSRIVAAMPKGLPMVCHFHNDYGLGTINAITAVSCGFKVVSVTANGYGERAGNVKLHEFVTALNVLYGVEIPGFKYHKLRELARFMERISGIPMQQHEPIVGEKVFAHESGIHTHAMLIDHRMYEAVPAALVGGETNWIFGKHSGVALVEDTLRHHSEELASHGIEVTPELAGRVTEEIKRLREERAASSKSEEAIDAYESAMRRLSITESDVAAIAIALAKPQAVA